MSGYPGLSWNKSGYGRVLLFQMLVSVLLSDLGRKYLSLFGQHSISLKNSVTGKVRRTEAI